MKEKSARFFAPWPSFTDLENGVPPRDQEATVAFHWLEASDLDEIVKAFNRFSRENRPTVPAPPLV